LVGLQPDIIVTNLTPATVAVQRETRTIPIVFANVGDPVASGIVPRLNQPGGNITGFAILERSLGGKWLELLSEIAPGHARGTGLGTVVLKRISHSALVLSRRFWVPVCPKNKY
jgi:putative ABC transport system substrate-binding protein